MTIAQTNAHRLPTNRDEHWKYAKLRGLDTHNFLAAIEPTTTTTSAVASVLPAKIPELTRVVLIDGYFSQHLSDPLPQGLSIKVKNTLPDNKKTRSARVVPQSVDYYFASLNSQHAAQVFEVRLSTQTRYTLEILCIATSGNSYPALDIELYEGATLTLIEEHLNATLETSTLTNLSVMLTVGADAKIDYTRVQKQNFSAQYFDTLEITLADRAHCQLVSVASGAAASRSTVLLNHQGTNSALQWQAASLAQGAQVNDAYVRITHGAPGARTKQMFRGIASGRAKIGFNGHMQVTADAPGSSADQSIKCLLTGVEAEANVRPQLEIYTDDVRATHGATVGKLDNNMLFYMLSRGIPEVTAQALLKWAFIADVIAKISLPLVREKIQQSLSAQFPGGAQE